MLTTDESVLLPCNLGSLSGTLNICNMEMVLLNAIGQRTVIDTLVQGDTLFCSAKCTFSFRACLTVPANWCLLGYIHHTDEYSWCHGTSLTTDTAFTVLTENNSEFMFSAGSIITLMLLPFEALKRKLSEIDPRQTGMLPRLHTLFHLSETSAAQRLKVMYGNVRERLIDRSVPHEGDSSTTKNLDIGALLESHLAANLVVTARDLPNCSRGRRKHYLILQRAERFMRANLRSDIYINEMCNAAEVSERALRYAFEDLLGISPNRYLSMLRLCTACRSLASSDISRQSVKSVALSCGLWDLSRFADSYRRVFGELPHDTLMRAQLLDSSPLP